MPAFPTIRPRAVGDELVQTVNARDLHACLDVGRDFSSWIKSRLARYGFALGVDYVVVQDLSSPDRGSAKARAQALIAYHLTLDTAKELAMVENNDRGRAVRRYFITCERRLRDTIPSAHSASPDQPLSVRLRAVEACRHTFGVAAAQALWFAIGLPIVPAMCRPAAQTEMPFDLSVSAVGGQGDVPPAHGIA